MKHQVEKYSQLIDMVREFYFTFNIPRCDLSRVGLRLALYAEEREEFKKALEEDNQVEVLDAICDMHYIAFGTYLEFWEYRTIPQFKEDFSFLENNLRFSLTGLKSDFESELQKLLFTRAFAEVHRSNMTKCWDTSRTAALMCDPQFRVQTLDWTITDNVYNGKSYFIDKAGKVRKPYFYEPPRLKEIMDLVLN